MARNHEEQPNGNGGGKQYYKPYQHDRWSVVADIENPQQISKLN